MNKLERRMAAADRFAEAQARAKIPGSPILDKFVAEMQAKRRQKMQNAVSSSSITSDSEYYEWLTGGVGSAGVAVTEQTVMKVSAVYASVNLIAGAIASMPLPIYRKRNGERERIDHDYWRILNRQPNDMISAAVFWEFMLTSLLLNGDAFARIVRPVGGRSPVVLGLDPLHKGMVRVTRSGGRLWYHVTDRETNKTDIYNQDDMIHIPGPGFDGLNGKSQIQYALRNAAGIALAADEYSSAFFSNGARPDIALEMPGNPTEEQQKMMRSTWQERYQGAVNAHKPALLAGGIKLHELTINAEDAQLIGTRQFQVEDVARIFGVPPHMIGHTEKTTSWGSGVEAMGIGFVKYTLQRHLVKIEQELNRKLFTAKADQNTFCEFLTSGLERGDFKTRNDGYRVAIGRAGEPGWMTVNEIRKLENLPSVAEGDTLNTGANNANQPTA